MALVLARLTRERSPFVGQVANLRPIANRPAARAHSAERRAGNLPHSYNLHAVGELARIPRVRPADVAEALL